MNKSIAVKYFCIGDEICFPITDAGDAGASSLVVVL